ncbi:magnesium-translocating P-type ATPase [Mycobacterium sp. PDNC021]|uniref:magnesium-translocating P-type ATPase n=1 Tax=Mycobacterium sp. PDNC021 TaxID=3391399 RepID=UPI003AB05780
MTAPGVRPADYAGVSVFEVLSALASTPRGLTEQEASERLGEAGENRQPVDRPPAWTDRLKIAAGGPFVALLLGLGVVLGAVGDARGSVTVATMVALCVGVRCWQQMRSDRAMRALREYTTYTATVRRRLGADTATAAYEIPVEDLVPGDVVLLSPGEVIHADLRVIATQGLRVDQSALSGESLPVDKSAEPVDGERRGPLDGPNMCFAGTSVVSGSGTAVVVATGPRTYWAAATLAGGRPRPRTSVDAGVSAVGATLMRFMIVMIPIVLAVSGAITGDWAQAGLFAVSVAVGLMPELLPVIVAATFLRGAVNLTRRRVIVKRLESICDLGAIDVLCLDKTGTLTEDRVAYACGIDIDGRPDEQVDTYACVAATFQDVPYNLLDAALGDLVDADQHILLGARFTKIGETPFDVYQRQSSVVVQERSDEHLVITKGDPDAVLRLCSHAQLDGVVTELSADLAQQGRDLVASLQRNGMRVLAVAAKPIAVTGRLDHPAHDASGSVLVGFVGFVDPIKATAAAAVRDLDAAGISAKVLTGDAPEVAEHLCRAAGLPIGHIVTGSDIEALSPDELCDIACRTTVFARVDPQQKARIVSALRTAGHTVGFIGDGINDSSALRVADVGICVDTATDVARHAADLILLDKDLTVVTGAVTEGRRTLGNTMKYVKITTASNVGNAASVLLAGALLPFLPMLPIQLMVQNLLYEITQLTLPFDRVDPDYLSRPRRWQSTGLTSFAIAFGLLSSVFDLATFATLWWIVDANTVAVQTMFQTGWFLEGLLSQVLVVLVLRSRHGLRAAGTPALPLLGAVIAVVIVGLCLPFTPFAHWVGLTPLPGEFFGWLALILGAYLAAAAALKRRWVSRTTAFP